MEQKRDGSPQVRPDTKWEDDTSWANVGRYNDLGGSRGRQAKLRIAVNPVGPGGVESKARRLNDTRSKGGIWDTHHF